MSDTIEGRCHCGSVRLQVPSSAFGVVACHCGDCQKLHGNFFAMLAVERAELRYEGEDELRWYASSEKARRSFCGRCGSRVSKEPHGGTKVLVSVGLFEPSLQRRIAKNVWPQGKPAWYELPSEEPHQGG